VQSRVKKVRFPLGVHPVRIVFTPRDPDLSSLPVRTVECPLLSATAIIPSYPPADQITTYMPCHRIILLIV
jgi:hypothetical protein